MAQLDESRAATDTATNHIDDHNQIHKKMNYVLDVKDFGAVGDGSTDDTAAVQLAFDAQTAAIVATTDGEGNTLGMAPTVYFPPGRYLTSATINMTSPYGGVQGDLAILSKATVFTGTAAISAAAPAWRVWFEGLQFEDYATGIYVDTNNVNSGSVRVEKCGFFSCTTYGLHLDVKSSTNVVKDCIWRDCKHELYIERSDAVEVYGGWMQRGLLTDNYDGGIVVDLGRLHMQGTICVPQAQTVTEPCWVKLGTSGSSFSATAVRFGGEPGSHATVNNNFAGTATTSDAKSGIAFLGCEIYSGNDPVVRLFEIPNTITFTDNRGFTGATSTLIDWSSTINGAAQATKVAVVYPSGNTALHRISAYGNILEETIPDNLLPFADIPAHRRIGDTGGGSLVFDRRDVAIASGEIYGNIEWYGHDASAQASGVRSEIRTEATATAGGVKVVIAAKANAGLTLVDAAEFDSSGMTVLEDVGFYGTAPVAQQTGVAVSAAGIHAALVSLGLITA